MSWFIGSSLVQRKIAYFVVALILLAGDGERVLADGHVTGRINEDGLIEIVTTHPVHAQTLDLRSEAGLLVPSESAAPFTFHLANEPTSVSLAAIPGTSVTLDGRVLTSTGYSGSLETAASLAPSVG